MLKTALYLNSDLFAWLTRRPISAGGARVVEPSRDNAFLPLVLVATLSLPVETLLFVVLIPAGLWWLRDILLAVSVEATLLVWGFYASTVRRPHLLTEAGLLIRWSRFTDRLIRYEAVARAEARRDRPPTGQFGLTFHPREASAYVTNGLSTNFTVDLLEPVVLSGLQVGTRSVTRIHLDLRDPIGAVDELAARVVRDGGHPAAVSGRECAEKSREEGPARNTPSLSSRALVGLTLAMEVPLFAIGYLWMQARGLDPLAELRPSAEGLTLGVALGLALAGLSLGSLVLASRVPALGGWPEFVHGTLGRYLGPASLPALAVLAVCAGLGEEVFFRGALQLALGLVPTALIFGLAHVGIPRRDALPFLAYTALVGLVFGVVRLSQPLFLLVVAHTVVDLVDATYLHLVHGNLARARRGRE